MIRLVVIQSQPNSLNAFGYASANPESNADPTEAFATRGDTDGGSCGNMKFCLGTPCPYDPCVDPATNSQFAGGEYTYRYHGVTVVNNATGYLGNATAQIAGPGGTIAWTDSLIVSTTEIPYDSPLLAHEMGHIIQARRADEARGIFGGVTYLTSYLIDYVRTGLNHAEDPAEKDANFTALLQWNWNGGPPPSWWEFPEHRISGMLR